jgi:hypothetical protein
MAALMKGIAIAWHFVSKWKKNYQIQERDPSFLTHIITALETKQADINSGQYPS